jgi:hypothetical protein
METNNDHKTCYSCKSYIDELENQNESEITQPELDEQNTILKETSSNNNNGMCCYMMYISHNFRRQLFCHIDYKEFHLVLHLTLDYIHLE